jgi:AcrR family transcriptional regulator
VEIVNRIVKSVDERQKNYARKGLGSMKSDVRIRYTKMIIRDSFVQALKSQPVNKISVKEICELAEINRTTFYKYYTDCFDLLKQIEDELIVELQQLVNETRNKNLSDVFVKILSKMRESGSLYMALFSENGDSSFPSRIFNLCYEQIAPPIETSSASKIEQEWLYYFMAYGCSGVINHWAGNGMKEDIYEVAKYVDKLSKKLLK